MNPRRIAVNPNHNLDLCPFNPKTITLVGYLKVIPYTEFEHFGIIRFDHSFLSCVSILLLTRDIDIAILSGIVSKRLNILS